ncbi:MAG: Nif3-like dinuclear metal center hexameric protein [Firmicutes bacterium]|nr:Nif3-like dinuclear metal center hexameric protein [Bacillota bacterium]MCL2255667.1 Nif3-like dinuclear metal center hexameric protein [Bacillota bacterium]
MLIKELTKIIEDFAPSKYQYVELDDNIGLIVGDENESITKVICCLDVTESVINEAIKENANLIISHHPVIYRPIRNITAQTPQGRKLQKAIKHGISIYSAHTNLDFCPDGINDYCMKVLGLVSTEVLCETKNNVPFGRIGILEKEIKIDDFVSQVEKIFNDKVKVVPSENSKTVKKIALLNGGGGGDTFLIDEAVKSGCDTLMTADVPHHNAIHALEMGLNLIEPAHYSMEHIFIPELVRILKEKTNNKIEIFQSKSEKKPKN